MKPLRFINNALCLLTISLLWVSCQKTDSVVAVLPDLSAQKAGGLRPDDPKLVEKVPLVISENYLNAYYAPLYQSRGTSSTSTKRDRTAPVVSIVSPTNGSTVSGTVNVSVSATDNVGVASVTLRVDGVALATKTAAPYTFSWNSSAASVGNHTFEAVASDASGNSAVTGLVYVGVNAVVTGDITSPLVSITSPTTGSAFSAGTGVSITASASDNVGVASVLFQIDGVSVATVTTAPYTYNWNTTGVASGNHAVTATARDAAGNATSASVTLMINTTVLPTIILPSSVQLNMPPVIHQGGAEGSCAAMATTYYARSAEYYFAKNATTYSNSNNIFSPEFVFNQLINGDCSGGIGLVQALNFMISNGVCTFQSMPYDGYNGCTLMPTATQNSEALNYRIPSFSRVISSDINAMKTMLVNKHPLIIGASMDQNFVNAGPGFIWTTPNNLVIAHALTICGYDDSKNAFRVVNSAGTTWGDAGYSWIDYGVFSTGSVGFYSYAINR